MENDEKDFGEEDVMKNFYDKLQENQSVTVNAGDIVKRIALNTGKSVEMVSEVIRAYLKIIIYSEQDLPDFDEQTSFFMFSHLDELDRIEMTYSKDNNGKTSVAIGLLAEKPKNTIYS
ncbi:MAG: hypothetical protein H6Q16_401 [Bacteroidetes bacterium]|nr:hypothetical protein [Bacteroidota bacterium]